jgi:hypothetical protein
MHGPLGMLIDVIYYIKTPQQYNVFANFQRLARQDLPADDDAKFQILEPVKPCVTRWNSFCSAFERAVLLKPAFNSYISFYIKQRCVANSHAQTKNNKTPQAPAWMRSEGLTTSDWAVTTEYIEVLKPLEDATKRFESRGKCGRFGAIYEIIPVLSSSWSALSCVSGSTRGLILSSTRRLKITSLPTFARRGRSSASTTANLTTHPRTLRPALCIRTIDAIVRRRGATSLSGLQPVWLTFLLFGRSTQPLLLRQSPQKSVKMVLLIRLSCTS